MTKIISASELAQQLGTPGLVIVDVRPMAAYNGWRLQGEERGGHIRGAIACPLSWTKGMGAADLMALLEQKGITPDKTIVVYGYSGAECAPVVDNLEDMGYKNVLLYEAGLPEWAVDEALPMARLPKFEKLVHPQWLHQLIDGQHPETYRGNEFIVVHVNFGVPEEYEDGHIPGAIYLDTNKLEASSNWNRRPADELEAALLAHGITKDKLIVLYGRDSIARPGEVRPGQHAGQISATRAATVLMYAGVEDVRVLDGGYGAWVSAGYPEEREGHEATPAEDFGVRIPAHPDYMADIDEARELLARPDGVLVSIRTWAEYTGETSGYNYIGRTGRIAGAVWGNCGTDAYHMQHYRNVDNTMRDYHEIETNWREVGITPDKRVAFYCGTGWRASETFFYAHLMGWPHVAVYDGGWFEWSRDESNPVEVGEP